MKRFEKAVLLITAIAFLAALTLAGCASSQKPGAVAVEEVTATATITSIDPVKRAVSLKFGDGSTKGFIVSDAVKNFDQMKVGDIVRSTVVESVAIYVKKMKQDPDVKVEKSVNVAPKGQKPGIAITETFELTAKIESIDLNKGTITLKTPSGDFKTFAIKKSEDSFKNIKIGDDVVVDVTMAVILDVEAPAAK